MESRYSYIFIEHSFTKKLDQYNFVYTFLIDMIGTVNSFRNLVQTWVYPYKFSIVISQIAVRDNFVPVSGHRQCLLWLFCDIPGGYVDNIQDEFWKFEICYRCSLWKFILELVIFLSLRVVCVILLFKAKVFLWF